MREAHMPRTACMIAPQPTPGEEPVGTWILLSTTETGELIEVRIVIRKDGTFKQSYFDERRTRIFTGTWEMVGDKLITTVVFDPVGGEVSSEEYTVRDGRLTLVDDDDEVGPVLIWHRERSG